MGWTVQDQGLAPPHTGSRAGKAIILGVEHALFSIPNLFRSSPTPSTTSSLDSLAQRSGLDVRRLLARELNVRDLLDAVEDVDLGLGKVARRNLLLEQEVKLRERAACETESAPRRRNGRQGGCTRRLRNPEVGVDDAAECNGTPEETGVVAARH